MADENEITRKKRFCNHGHDTQVVGTRKVGNFLFCVQCLTDSAARRRERYRGNTAPKPPRVTPQFCIRGHDTHVVGRRKTGMCRECNRLKDVEYKRKQRATNPGFIRARYRRNAEKFRQKRREYCEKYPQKLADYRQRYKEEHPGRQNQLARESYRRNRARCIQRARLDYIRRFNTYHEDYDYDEAISSSSICGICRRAFGPKDKRSLDHIVPIIRGGPDVQSNVQPAHCRCNSVKQGRLQEYCTWVDRKTNTQYSVTLFFGKRLVAVWDGKRIVAHWAHDSILEIAA